MKKQTRAINAEQKEERRLHILNTATHLLLERGYDQIQMLDVAKEAGLAKGTLYLYFRTKEELFLTILSESFERWFDDLNDRLKNQTALITIEAFLGILLDLITAYPVWMQLVPISHVILERNINHAAALDFKQMLARGLQRSGLILEEQAGFLNKGQGAPVLLEIYTILIGVQNFANPAPVVRDLILENPTLAVFNLQSTDLFHSIVESYLIGISKRNQGVYND